MSVHCRKPCHDAEGEGEPILSHYMVLRLVFRENDLETMKWSVLIGILSPWSNPQVIIVSQVVVLRVTAKTELDAHLSIL